ncbi:hypothetical protein GLOTRDRAFT_105675 [Gloeophyllum trabeum ATCC 11539]|uniref:Meiotically up-regulated protein Msb1/Mug8 domain-containing protein n=1 Tax=Gloeophyllum trabeum (strain ATCC 11539 / FP-39264 / Madison 617) TaxID=670483 RepID=S7RRT8_GLOTA|nr:uncharacterized protein GLOTRDRAFT_105675 [Gloeophyllum trabeum ATCC 11539]EPQ55709.1 hypothetical protein GLOTRDRAFT_105675 [Gloeophyllum trabeum ATCC 11539]
MPSFLTKVFGRNKDDKEAQRQSKRASVQSSLLEGKFEAVSPTVSPSATDFAERSQENEKLKQKEKDGGIQGIFRAKSRTTSPTTEPKPLEPPHLSLNLPGLKDERSSRPLGSVFDASPDGGSVLSESVIGERRLTPAEALVLVRTCSQAIVERGLETLGIMHPHWYSSSPDVQRRLISQFILSLSSDSTVNNSDFASEIAYARSPHDVAAVLRWGLRHLKIEGDSFGTDRSWYTKFYGAEKAESYPRSAYSDKLVPLLPSSHAALLSVTLDIVSSLAAHGEANGISGSKLTKLLGLWLLTARRAENSDDWKQFYARWEWAGRVLEHLFLAKIRDEAVKQRMPKRLTELVTQYPYDKTSTDGLLPRPRFSTRRYDALFVHIDTEVPRETKIDAKQHPLHIIADALRSESVNGGNLNTLWGAIKTRASNGQEAGEGERGKDGNSLPLLSNILSDDSIRLLSLVRPEGSSPDGSTSSLGLLTPVIRVNEPKSRARSSSAGGFDQSGEPNGNGHYKTISASTGKAHEVYGSTTDWTQFSTSGFAEPSTAPSLALTLMDKDVEVTNPDTRNVSRRKSNRRKSSPPERKDAAATNGKTPSPSTPSSPAKPPKASMVSLVQLDEAFIDFWSDALTDPISSDWPNFVVCQLKSTPEFTVEGGKPVNWLVIEEALVHPPPPSPTEATPRASSPRPSYQSSGGGRKSSTFSIGKKKFSLFGTKDVETSISAGKKKEKVGKRAKVGEMGEVLQEEDEKDREKHETAEHGAKVTNEVSSRAAEAPVAASTSSHGVDLAALHWAEGKEPEVPSQKVYVPAEQLNEAAIVPAPDAALATPLSNDAKELIIEEESAEGPMKVATAPAAIVPVDASGDALPPAPENVVTSGATPGPQLALDTSEPVAAASAGGEEVDVQPAYVEISPASEDVASSKVHAVEEKDEPVAEDAGKQEAAIPTDDIGFEQHVVADEGVSQPSEAVEKPEEPAVPEEVAAEEHAVASAAVHVPAEPEVAQADHEGTKDEEPAAPVETQDEELEKQAEPEVHQQSAEELPTGSSEPSGIDATDKEHTDDVPVEFDQPSSTAFPSEPVPAVDETSELEVPADIADDAHSPEANNEVESESLERAPTSEDLLGKQPRPEDSHDIPAVAAHMPPEGSETVVVPATFEKDILEQGSDSSSIAYESRAPTSTHNVPTHPAERSA